jgi:amino-acid N-acetyltransferase
MDEAMTVCEADLDQLDRVIELLADNDLPTDDVPGALDHLVVALAGGEVVGAGGVEVHGSAGLLRSVVVEDSFRGRGAGTAVCDALEDKVRRASVETLYLLTTTAASFFRRRGYETVAREEAPSDVRETAEFADLCPASATCMAKNLG